MREQGFYVGWAWAARMGHWVSGGTDIVRAAPRAWAFFAIPPLLLAAIPFPNWLMDGMAPLGLLGGLWLAGRCDGQVWERRQIIHGIEVAFLWGILLALFNMLFAFAQDTVMIGALLSGLHASWTLPTGHSLWDWWMGFSSRLSDLAMMPYFWFSPAFFGVALALHKGQGWIEAEIETTLALLFRQELRDPLIGLWAVILVSSVLLPQFSQVWLALLIWVLGPPVVHVAYEDIFANKRRPPRKQRERRSLDLPVLQPEVRKVPAG